MFNENKKNIAMVITIKSGDKADKIQSLLNKLSQDISKKEDEKKKSILYKTFGKVKFHPSKSPTELQKELRDEWG